MKYYSLFILLICSLIAQAKDRVPAFDKGAITATLAVGMPNLNKVLGAYTSIGPYSASADYQLNKRFCANLLYSYMYSAAHLQTVKSMKTQNSFECEQRSAVSTIMATGQYCYLNRGRVWMSMGLGFGVAIPKNFVYFPDGIDHSDEIYIPKTRFVYRLRLLDIKVKVTKNFSVYGGIGEGLDGVLSAGINYNITGRE
jgi:hypothetical protein